MGVGQTGSRDSASRTTRPATTRATRRGSGRRASGTARDGRSFAWNLVSGINDPPSSSERTIWVAGKPTEPGPVQFQGLDSIHFEDESRLNFTAETQRSHHEGIPLFARSDYEAPPRHLQRIAQRACRSASALGVMEAHDAVW